MILAECLFIPYNYKIAQNVKELLQTQSSQENPACPLMPLAACKLKRYVP
jgi:hypothetical protein